EYNWLIKITPETEGHIAVTLRKSGLFTLGVAFFCFLCVALHAHQIGNNDTGLSSQGCVTLLQNSK
ncbi:MAG: hypothetical protein ABI273_13470, partial [Lacunisphaera sp.]